MLIGLEDRPDPSGVPLLLKPGSAEERAALLAVLERTGENITSTADALRVSRVTLYRYVLNLVRARMFRVVSF
jgi:transcriptional regulator of acetoin/glycerol metabolism